MKARDDKYQSFYTLSDYDRKGHLSMRRLYMEISDPTEYRVGVALLGDYRHWQHLCSLSWFKPYVEKWRMELREKVNSEAVEALREIVKDPKNGSRVPAARMLLEKPWEKGTTLRGRPSKDEVEGYKQQVAQDAQEQEEDYKRLFGEQDNT
jgi:hypothetical protein